MDSQPDGERLAGELGYLVTIQPVGTDKARNEALARWGPLPKYIDTEIGNLREGLKRGYSAPKGNVRIVIGQMEHADSDADSPTRRSTRRRCATRPPGS